MQTKRWLAWIGTAGLLAAAACSDPSDTDDGGAGGDGSDDAADASGDDGGDAGDDGAGADVPTSPYCADVADWADGARDFEEQVLVLVNEARGTARSCGGQSFGATDPLRMEGRLRCAARVHSLDMATRGYFDHNNPEGESPFDRMGRAGYEFRAAGENIAAGQPTPEAVVSGWLDSPGHCSNIMSPDFQEIGVGYFMATDAPFPHYWTQVFGTQL